MKQKWFGILFLILISALTLWSTLKHDTLSKKDQAVLHQILAHWETGMPARKKDGTAPLLTFEELSQGLSPEESKFLDRIRAIRPKNKIYFEIPKEKISFKRISGQQIIKEGKSQTLDPQYLPDNVYAAYTRMMLAMQKDLGKHLLVDSGYRSPAYQLYTFLFYMPKHHYSIRQTREWVALPGYSEHGAPHTQAVDFINQEGVNGDDRPEDFEQLPEYAWLQQHAKEFGFELSYPRGMKGTTFEPWHWRYIVYSSSEVEKNNVLFSTSPSTGSGSRAKSRDSNRK